MTVTALQPAWLGEAWAELGIAERPGPASAPRVIAMFRDAGNAEITSDEVAWCAAFAGACLQRAGHRPTGSLMARSYLKWGAPLDAPRPGAVVVLTRGSDPNAGHVGFWLGETASQLILLGGNQSDAVTVAAFDKSRLIGMRWPLDQSDTAPATSPNPDTALKPASDFDTCLAHVLEMEGGYTNDPHDPGGPTNHGITLATFARHLGEPLTADSRAPLVARLRSIEHDTVVAIYARNYWTPSRAADMPAAVALMHFDASVNHGVLGAARLLQGTLGVEVDGEIGPITLAAVQHATPATLVTAYANARRERYRELPHFWRFGRGWLNRVTATERRAALLLSSPATPKGTPMATADVPSSPPTQAPTQAKWWGESLTIWGVIVTAASTVLPVIGPILGLDLSPDLIRQLGDQTLQVAQALAGLLGTAMAIYGRTRATLPLARRSMVIQL